MAKNDSFLGTSLAFPFRFDGKGGLATVSDEEAVEHCIRAIIESPKGSHLMEPWLGWPIAVFQHANNLYAIAEVIKQAVLAGEDRVDPQSLQVDVEIDDSGELRTSITYSIRGEYDSRTLQHGFRVIE
jgi:hypothetical protein